MRLLVVIPAYNEEASLPSTVRDLRQKAPDVDFVVVNDGSADRTAEICRDRRIPIGIITTPAEEAQAVCDQLVAAGIKAVWNFAHVHLHVPEGVLVQNEDMAVSFALLSNRLAQKLRAEEDQASAAKNTPDQ